MSANKSKELFMGCGPDTDDHKEMIRRIDSGDFEMVLMVPAALKSLLIDLDEQESRIVELESLLESAVKGDDLSANSICVTSVNGGNEIVDLTARIQRAAEEIISHAGSLESWPLAKNVIEGIIKRHLDGGGK